MRTIVIGGGEVGFHIAGRLADEKKDVVVVDRDPEKIRRAQDTLDLLAVRGEGSSPRVLKEAGIEDAELVIAVTDSDEVNMIACVIARAASRSITTVARVRNLEYVEMDNLFSADNLGIDLVINPEMEAARQVQRLLEVPAAREVFDFGEGRVRLVGVDVEAGSEAIGIELQYLKALQAANGVLVAAIERDGDVLVPQGSSKIEAGDNVWLVTDPRRTTDVLAAVGKRVDRIEDVVLYGGGNVTYYLARELVKDGIKVKIIEEDYGRCARLAEEIPQAVILHGSGIDQDLLEEENVGVASAFIALTHDDEDNILGALLAKQLGSGRVITLANKKVYLPVIPAIGVDKVVSIRMAAVDKILQYVRRGKVLAATSLENLDVELLEFRALATSEIVAAPLKDLQLPRGAIFAAVVRGDRTIIPSGALKIEPDDRVTVFAKRKAVSKLEKMFAVKLEYF